MQPTEANRIIAQRYASDLAAAGGIEWSKAESTAVGLEAYRPRLHTIPELAPGCASSPFPRTLQGVAPATEAQRRQLLVDFDGALAAGQWARALRFAVVAELVRRTTRIQLARGGACAAESVLHASDRPLPTPPPELRPVFHGLAYGHRAVDLALMGAVGVRPIAGALAGFEAVDPLYVYVRVRNHISKRAVQVPAVVGRAWIADAFLDQDDPEALARRCRPLVARPDDIDGASPLAMLELHALACIPSGQLVLPPLKGPPKYEHLFGVANDTRHFWLTAYQTDRRQLPCAPILTPAAVFEPALEEEPDRLHAMRVLADARLAEERAMFQVMLGVWGIDRLILGRPLVWRDAAGAAEDDLRFFASLEYPQWIPQRLPPRDDDDFRTARRRLVHLFHDVDDPAASISVRLLKETEPFAKNALRLPAAQQLVLALLFAALLLLLILLLLGAASADAASAHRRFCRQADNDGRRRRPPRRLAGGASFLNFSFFFLNRA